MSVCATCQIWVAFNSYSWVELSQNGGQLLPYEGVSAPQHWTLVSPKEGELDALSSCEGWLLFCQ